MEASTHPTPQFPNGSLPPEGEYVSRDALHTAINTWAAPNGYAFVTGKSTRTASGRRSVTYVCDRAGAPRNLTATRRRQTNTRRTGCQFSVLAKETLDKSTWRLTHRQGTQFASHNHSPSSDLTLHPTHRQLSSEDRSTVNRLANAGMKPTEIRSYLRVNTQSLATQQDIYNCIAQGKKELAKGQSSIHVLADELDNDGLWKRTQLDEDNRMIGTSAPAPAMPATKTAISAPTASTPAPMTATPDLAAATSAPTAATSAPTAATPAPTAARPTPAAVTSVSTATSLVSITGKKVRYSHPCAIYQRYVAAREAWYTTQSRDSLKTNERYRKAMHLPQRYNKSVYEWCVDYKQMGKRCTLTRPGREWTKEEMMAYVDFDKAEDKRVETRVAAEMAVEPISRRRGMQAIWEAAGRDLEEEGDVILE